MLISEIRKCNTCKCEVHTYVGIDDSEEYFGQVYDREPDHEIICDHCYQREIDNEEEEETYYRKYVLPGIEEEREIIENAAYERSMNRLLNQES